jgi:sugar/nucleoside kinase (ribokinase family)
VSAKSRLILVDSVVVDVVLNVDALPERGSDTSIEHSDSFAGGGFNVMAAASRLGLPSVYGGVVGLGPFATIAQEAMRLENIIVATAPIDDVDTGFVVAIVESGGERTFLTSNGAEATLSTTQLDSLDVTESDFVYFSGYALLHESNSRALLSFLHRIPVATRFLFDPGPLVAEIPLQFLGAIYERADWFSCNAREALLLTESSNADAAAGMLLERMNRGGVIVRVGAGGCVLARRDHRVQEVPGFSVESVDTNGAGDCHVGAFAAQLALGRSAVDAARWANAAAAYSVTRPGPANGPTTSELDDFIERHR